MEPGVVAAVILIVLIGGTAAVVARQRSTSWGMPALRTSAAGLPEELPGPQEGKESDPNTARAMRPTLLRATAQTVTRSGNAGLELGQPALQDPARLDIAPTLPTLLTERLERIEARLDEVQRELARQSDTAGRISTDLRAQRQAEEVQWEAALERLRLNLLSAMGNLALDQGSGDRRAEVSADLYARLARLESALSAVTNPILLPGETYAPPAELPTEALIWENWNEVGERAFALADAYSAQRLHLSDQTSAALGEFVTALRVLLTRSVYPNLQGHPDAAQQAALRTALEEMAVTLPKVRESLTQAHHDESSG